MLSSPSQPSPYRNIAREVATKLAKELEEQEKCDTVKRKKLSAKINDLNKRIRQLRDKLNADRETKTKLAMLYGEHKEQVEHVVVQRLPQPGEEVTVKARTDPGHSRQEMLAYIVGVDGDFWKVHSPIEVVLRCTYT